ncbi:uncharacterized protein LOC117528857 isoform X2 [Thalassophryne amazonica]|uniref:uncharacterized protein LOC117528857 isoform X2 n=1 Tax=Thalassophryne amazonica TaxID=390379 RepID=UPI00147244BD|nr:uncharacterized protein LOC117528857 isoform X2 [Thalassophryne amazonica]
MEVVPVERNWTEDKERLLIAFFSKHSCLWNHKSESYKNRELRTRTLERLRILLSAHPPPVPFTVDNIKSKFKNLRTTFQRQHKLVKASETCSPDRVFMPQWKHYQQLMFLQGSLDQEDATDDLPPRPPSPLTVQKEEKQLIPIVSSPLSSNMIKCYWTEEREHMLIFFYSEHSCLWNKKSENYNNRQLRVQLLERLRHHLSDQSVSFSVEDVKCKFKNFRTIFNREYKAVQESKVSDKPYVSKWKHYQQLLFLCECCDEDETSDDLCIMTPKEETHPDPGTQTVCSTVRGFFSSSTQSGSNAFSTSGHSDAQKNSPSPYLIFLSASPDSLKPSSQRTRSTTTASPSGSVLPDTKPVSPSPAPLMVSTSSSVKTDVRLSAEPHCHWTEDKVHQLITFFSDHSCLWNHRLDSYRNRLLRQRLLESLSVLLSENEPIPFTVDDIKTKFRNLRTIFQREHKSVSANKTCGSEDFYLPKWKHYRDMMFLCDSCDEDDCAEDLNFHESQESSLVCLSRRQARPSQQYQTNGTKVSLDPLTSPTPHDPQHAASSSSPSTSGHQPVNLQAPTSTTEFPNLKRTFDHMQMMSPHAGFIKYVEECLNETPPDRVKKLKKKIIETIHSMSEDF